MAKKGVSSVHINLNSYHRYLLQWYVQRNRIINTANGYVSVSEAIKGLVISFCEDVIEPMIEKEDLSPTIKYGAQERLEKELYEKVQGTAVQTKDPVSIL